ncbi:MAG: biopolymer transporter ExbD [Simkaniaceae bacterium]|nr:biopolymer transporter ExbD [Simkaniaceae bacterium]
MRYRLPFEEPELDEGGLNLTPLIDVVFVVLIMFIIIAPLVEIDRISLASGKPIKKHAPINEQPITIHVKGDNTIYINHRLVALSELSSVLAKLHETYPHQTPQIYHDKNATFGTYQTVKNTLELTGFEQMDVILKND